MGSSTQFEGLRQTILQPKKFFGHANKSPEKYISGALFITLLPSMFSIPTIHNAITRLLLISASMYLLGRVFRGKGRFSNILVCSGFANAPYILITAMFVGTSLIGGALLEVPSGPGFILSKEAAIGIVILGVFGIGWLVLMGAMVLWWFLLSVLVCKECHKTGAWLSVIITISSWIISAAIISTFSGLIS